MKLIDRQAVEGTLPVIYIGHRVYPKKNGEAYVSRTWYAEWCMHARHYHQALRTMYKQVAIRKAHDIRRRIEEGQVAPKVFKLRSGDLKEKYLELKRNEGRAPKTLEKYTFGMIEFDQWCEKTKRHSIVNFNVSDFWAFNNWMTETGRSEKTRYDRLILVKQAFKYAWKQKMIPEYLLVGASIGKPEPTEQPCFTQDQIATLLANANSHEAAIFAVMAYTGMRIGEVRDLKWTDIRWDVGQQAVAGHQGGT